MKIDDNFLSNPPSLACEPACSGARNFYDSLFPVTLSTDPEDNLELALKLVKLVYEPVEPHGRCIGCDLVWLSKAVGKPLSTRVSHSLLDVTQKEETRVPRRSTSLPRRVAEMLAYFAGGPRVEYLDPVAPTIGDSDEPLNSL